MPGGAVRDAKFGFWVAAGFLAFFLVTSVILGMSMWAVGAKK